MKSLPLTASLIAVSLSAAASAQTSNTPAAPADSRTTPRSATPDGDDFHTTDDLVVTAPYVRSLDLLGNVSVVQGDDLARDMRGQIGDTLARQAGVSATSFTPGASRPVLRGFQGERVRVLVDGIGSIDASNTSADHAVAFDSLTAERVEILRGPASLLFGSSAIGGAVNIFDRRIPRKVPEAPAHIDALATYGSVSDERSGAGSIDVPLSSQIVFHVDGAYAKTDDLEIGGYQNTPALRAAGLALAAQQRADGDTALANETEAAANQRGTIANSATRTWSAGSGIALVNDGGSLGVSIGYFDSVYGIPGFPGGEAGVSIDLKQWRADLRGSVKLGDGLFDELRVRAAFADYTHSELEDGNVGTTFLNQGIEARAELAQNRRGGWSGASGVQYVFRDFNAIGDEAFLPQNDTEQFALFTLQELKLGAVGLEASARYENSSVDARSIGYSRSFNAWSLAAGANVELSDSFKTGINFSRTARAPSAEELLSDGPHVATQSYERGDPNFSLEKAWSVEAFARYHSGPVELKLTGYASWFDNFIYAAETGAIEDDLPVFQYRQANARYMGLELEGSTHLAQFAGFTLIGDVTGDYVRARLSNNGGNIPRIPPLRLRGGLELSNPVLTVRGEVEWTAAQKKIAAFETPTDGFTVVNTSVAWKPMGPDGGVSLILSGNNLFDVVGRRHASFTKDFVPLAGRDIRLTARFSF